MLFERKCYEKSINLCQKYLYSGYFKFVVMRNDNFVLSILVLSFFCKGMLMLDCEKEKKKKNTVPYHLGANLHQKYKLTG